MGRRETLIGRGGLAFAWLVPALVIPISGAPVRNHMELMAWLLGCAFFIALIPGRRLACRITLGFLPFTIAWLGTVAVTGAGISSELTLVAMTASTREVSASLSVAMSSKAFWVSALLSTSMLVLACKLNKNASPSTDATKLGFLVLIGLLLLFESRGAFPHPRYEVRLDVPLLNISDFLQEMSGLAINLASTGKLSMDTAERHVSAATKEFDALPGVALLVVGESLRADSLAVRGRGKWSDALLARIDSGMGAMGAEACAGGGETFTSFPLLLTASTPSDLRSSNKPTVLAQAKAAGAKTAWVSNQENLIIREVGHDAAIRTASPNASTTLDEVAVEALGDWLAKQNAGTPKAAVLHLYGQHFHYADRYPLNMFPEDLPKEDSNEQYARAAEYGSKNLISVAAILDATDEPAFMLFTSDHGENLPSDGSGLLYHAGALPSRAVMRVPVLALWNKAFAESGRLSALERLLRASGPVPHASVTKAFLAAIGKQGDYPTDLAVKGRCDLLPR